MLTWHTIRRCRHCRVVNGHAADCITHDARANALATANAYIAGRRAFKRGQSSIAPAQHAEYANNFEAGWLHEHEKMTVTGRG